MLVMHGRMIGSRRLIAVRGNGIEVLRRRLAGQDLQVRDDRPQFFFGEPEFPRGHRRHLDAVLDDPEQILDRPFARHVGQIERRRSQAERKRFWCDPRRAVAAAAMFVVEAAPARGERRIG